MVKLHRETVDGWTSRVTNEDLTMPDDSPIGLLFRAGDIERVVIYRRLGDEITYTRQPEGVAVCDVCGQDEHTPEQLAACIDSALAPALCEGCGEEAGNHSSDCWTWDEEA